MDLIEFFCGKTPPRNHTISTKGMLLCWLDVKRPCVPKSGGKLWADHSEQPEWADQSEQTKAPHALWWRASAPKALNFPRVDNTLAPFCCLMFLAPQFPFLRKPCRKTQLHALCLMRLVPLPLDKLILQLNLFTSEGSFGGLLILLLEGMGL